MKQVCVALDLETTGLRPETDEIIEIAAVKFQGERVLGTFHTLVNPRCPLPLRTDRLTRISRDDLQGAPGIEVVAGDLVRFVQNFPLVGQSLNVDLAFLARKRVVLDNPVYDTFELASILLPDLTTYNLGSVADHLGIPFPIQHRALPDAEAAMKVILALAKRAQELDLSIVSDVSRLATKVNWSLAPFFQQIEREKSRSAFTNSIAEQLSSKMGLEEINLGFLTNDARRGEELIPVVEPRPVDVEKLSRYLRPGGLLSRKFPAFEHRPQQVQMMRAVAEAFNGGKHVIAEAGTGTGKSLAYLLPAVAYSVTNSCHVVISTNTINLQEQLVAKDIPDLRQVLESEESDADHSDSRSLSKFQVAVLKGRGNYLCLRRWSSFRKSEGLTMDEARVLARILVWLPSTENGDRSELNLTSGESMVWGKMCAQGDSCLAARCRFQQRGTCFLYRARRGAQSAHLIIVNHALLLSDVASESHVLPEYSHLVVDEAHHLEEEATEQFGYEVTFKVISSQLGKLLDESSTDRRSGLLFDVQVQLRATSVPLAIRKDIEKRLTDVETEVEQTRAAAIGFFGVAADFVSQHSDEGGGYDRRVLVTSNIRSESGWAELRSAWERLRIRLDTLEQEIEVLTAQLEQLAETRIEAYDELAFELGSVLQSGRGLRQHIQSIISEPDDEKIYWLSSDAQVSDVTLHEAPLHVGDLLNKAVFSGKETAILTSATLSTEGTFDYVKERLGLSHALEVIVESPFDYRSSTLLLVPTDIPEPGRPGYQRRLEQVVIDLCLAAEGRTLVLFTSNSALRATYNAIKPRLERENILILGHGIDGSRRQLLNSFKSNQRTVLLGTSSFWEGVDIAGEALSVLAIAKLPFSVPTDPVFRARSAMFHDAFNQYAVPQTVLKFKQGFGRLIRSRTDRGVVAILDSRVNTKSYGLAFLQSLPQCTESRGSERDLISAVRRWLASPT